MSIKCFTIATHSEGYFELLKDSCIKNNIKLDVIGYGEEYSGHMFKTYKTIEYLKYQSENDIILFVDGFDSIVLKDINIIVNRFKKLNVPFIFSKNTELKFIDKKISKFINLIKQNKFYDYFLIRNKPCKYKNSYYVLNSGMFMGYCKDLLDLFLLSLNYINNKNEHSNQRVLQDMCNNNINIPIDVNNNIFKNINDAEIKQFDGTNSCIISACGLRNMDNICKFYDYDIAKKIDRNKTKYREYSIKSINLKFVLFIIILICFILIYGYKMFYYNNS